MYAHRPFRKIGKRKQGGRIVFYAKEQLKCMEQDQRRCQQGGGGHSEHLLQTTWLRTWSGWDLLETIRCSLPIACLTCLLQQTFPSKNMLVRDLNSGMDIHVKLEKKPKQSKPMAKHHLPYPPANQQVLLPEFGSQFWYKRIYLIDLLHKGMHLACSREQKKVFKETICSNLYLCLLFCPQEDSFAF